MNNKNIQANNSNDVSIEGEKNKLLAISPLDGRYALSLTDIRFIMSEFGLIKNRINIEINWLLVLSRLPSLEEVRLFTSKEKMQIDAIVQNFSIADACAVKKLENTTNHDVKAVEYFVKQRLNTIGLTEITEFVHFGATSEDINNLSYALMLKQARDEILLPKMNEIIKILVNISKDCAGLAMISRTHGQVASPTTMGKELANTIYRLKRQIEQFKTIQIIGKFNGAVGNYNAYYIAYPNIKWFEISEQFVNSLGLKWIPYTTQIEPHDYIAEYLDCINRFNTILIDLNRDIWAYISLNYFTQKQKENEIGSSTMPHKVNPIDFENSEGNLGIAIAINEHLSRKLPISRLQRDLTDSTTLRNLGTGLAHGLVAYSSLIKGLGKLEINAAVIKQEIQQSWILLAEAIQTVMRRYQIEKPYEKLKELTRGKQVNEKIIRDFISNLDIDKEAKTRLLKLTPETYLGNAHEQANNIELAMSILEKNI